MAIDPAEAELLTLLKLNNKSLAEIGWPHEWHYQPYDYYWTKPGMKFTQGGVTVSTDYVLSDAQIQQFAIWARLSLSLIHI